MREATIIMPVTRGNRQDPDGAGVGHLRHELPQAFGGYTEHGATGVWVDPDTGRHHADRNRVFTVTCANTGLDTLDSLRHLAREAGRAAQQVCVYLKGFDGEVELIYCQDKPAETL